MKKAKFRRLLIALALAAGISMSAKSVRAVTVTKIHSAVQRIINITSTAGMNDGAPTTSSTVDLSGGDLDKCSFAISLTSGTGIGTGTLNVQVSPDGGTTWAKGFNISLSTNGLTAVTTFYPDVPVGAGTKLRVVPSLTANTTWYGFKLWAVPSAE